MNIKQNLIIISAGKFAREVYTWVMQAIETNGLPWTVKGFLDNRQGILDGFTDYPSIVGTVNDYIPEVNDIFLCAIGDPQLKKRYCLEIIGKGGQLATFIHPTALVGKSVRIGEGSIICPFTQLSCDIQLGKAVTFGTLSSVGHDVVIGDWCLLSGHCGVGGNAILEEGVFLGGHTTVLPGARVGAWSHVGPGSVVLRRVKSRTKVFGNPAVLIGYVDDAPVSE